MRDGPSRGQPTAMRWPWHIWKEQLCPEGLGGGDLAGMATGGGQGGSLLLGLWRRKSSSPFPRVQLLGGRELPGTLKSQQYH